MIDKVNKIQDWNKTEYLKLDAIFFETEPTDPMEISSGTNLLQPNCLIQRELKSEKQSYNIYTGPLGDEHLRAAILLREKCFFNEETLNYNLAVTSGAADGLRLTFSYLRAHGLDQGLVLGCQYPIVYQSMFVNEIHWDTLLSSFDEGYLPSYESVKQALDSNDYNFMFLTLPNNPSGMGYSVATFKRLCDYCLKNNIYIVYEKICSDGVLLSTETYKGYGESVKALIKREKMIIIDSFSKRRALSGLRIGYVLGPSQFMDYLNTVRFGDCPNTVGTQALIMDSVIDSYTFAKENRNIKLKMEAEALFNEFNTDFDGIELSANERNSDLRKQYDVMKTNTQYFQKKFPTFSITIRMDGINFLAKAPSPKKKESFAIAKSVFEKKGVISYPVECFGTGGNDTVNDEHFVFRVSVAEDEEHFKKTVDALYDFFVEEGLS